MKNGFSKDDEHVNRSFSQLERIAKRKRKKNKRFRVVFSSTSEIRKIDEAHEERMLNLEEKIEILEATEKEILSKNKQCKSPNKIELTEDTKLLLGEIE